MNLSPEAEKELLELARSEAFREDMALLSRRGRSPFMGEDGSVEDSYIAFVTLFNEFINHTPKPFRPLLGRNFKL